MIPAAIESSRVFAYPFAGYWRDVGTIKAYWDANMDLLNSQSGLNLSEWHVRTNVEEEGRLGDRPPTRISPKSSVQNAFVSPGCIIEGEVKNSILSPGVFVAATASVTDSVVMHDSHIHAGARVQRAILDKLTVVGNNAVVGSYRAGIPNKEKPDFLSSGLTLVGKGTEIPANFNIGENTILYPKLKPEDYHCSDIPPGETIRPST
ncbi:MAG: sugar phosphate nucleotidyltransferase [bacterium]